MIVLDTNVLSELMRANPSPTVINWVDKQDEKTLYLTSISLSEIRYGIAALPQGKRRTNLSQQFEQHIRPLFQDRILDFDEPASLEYASLRSSSRTKGIAISDYDALIAASVRAHKFDIATRDTAPFKAAGLHVVNPFSA